MNILESIKMQQTNIAGDGILLNYSIKEGMVDFISGLINGGGLKLKDNKEIRHHDKDDWAYWIGYQICEAYFNKANDKKQAVIDMINDHNINDKDIRLHA